MNSKTQFAIFCAAMLAVLSQAAAQERPTSWYGSGSYVPSGVPGETSMGGPIFSGPPVAPYAHVWQGYRGAAYEHNIHGLRYHSKPRLSDFLVYLFAPPYSASCGVADCHCGGSKKYGSSGDAHETHALDDTTNRNDPREWETHELDIPRPIQPNTSEPRPIESRPVEARPIQPRPIVDLQPTPGASDHQDPGGVIQLAPVPSEHVDQPSPGIAPRDKTQPLELPRNRLPGEQSSRRNSGNPTIVASASSRGSAQGPVLTASLLRVLGER